MENKTIAKIFKVGALITFLVLLVSQFMSISNIVNSEYAEMGNLSFANIMSILSNTLVYGIYCAVVFGIGVLIEINDTQKRILSHLLIPEIKAKEKQEEVK